MLQCSISRNDVTESGTKTTALINLKTGAEPRQKYISTKRVVNQLPYKVHKNKLQSSFCRKDVTKYDNGRKRNKGRDPTQQQSLILIHPQST